MKVRDPQGQVWRVSRRWLPWRRRVREFDGPPDDGSAGLGDDIFGLVLLVVWLVLAIPFLVMAWLAALELLLLLLLLPFVVLGRVLFGHHWHVELRRGWTAVWETDAGDWTQSRAVIARVAEDVRFRRHPVQQEPLHGSPSAGLDAAP